MHRLATKFAASTMIISMTMVGCQSDVGMLRMGSAWAASADTAKQAARYNEQAHRSLKKGDLAAALENIEQAVALSPRDAGYRLLLADIYLKSGRFDSAATSYADVLDLDGSNVRAGMTYALTQIALGRPGAAVAQLDELTGRAAPADIGLAYALAGYPERGIEILEPLARSLGATPRVRQNLALAYALAGDWKRARIVASQDVSPADLAGRMEHWASFAQPSQSWDQVASLLGVTPVQDPGQPVRLALLRERAATAYAEARPAEVPLRVEASAQKAPLQIDSAPLQFAAAAPVSIGPIAFPQPLPVETVSKAPVEAAPVTETAAKREQVRYVYAARSLVEPEPVVIRAALSDVAPPPPVFERTRPVRSGASTVPRARRAEPGRYVVQLGAFSNAENAERAWLEAERRFGLQSEQPMTTTIDWDGRVLHRVSVAGFHNSGEANNLCGSIKSRGGECFVREIAGDAPVRWAARYTRNG